MASQLELCEGLKTMSSCLLSGLRCLCWLSTADISCTQPGRAVTKVLNLPGITLSIP